MKGWFQRFMSGRYGFDQFGGFLCIASLILIVIGAWVSPILYWLGLAAIITATSAFSAATPASAMPKISNTYPTKTA